MDLIFDLYFLFIGDWGLGIGDWRLGIGPNPQSPIPNPQSPIPLPNIIKKFIIFLNFYFELKIVKFYLYLKNENKFGKNK